MKVLVYTNLYPSEAAPTFGVFNRHTFVALSRHCEVRVVVPTRAWTLLGHPADIVRVRREVSTGVEALFPTYYSVPRARFLHATGMYHSLRGRMRRLRAEFPWDVIVAAWAYPDAVAAARLADDSASPLVSVVLGTDIQQNHPLGVERQVRRGLGRACRVVAVSGALGERAIELGASRARIRVIHNAVDGARFTLRSRADARRALGLDPERPTIGYVGNLRFIKGSDLLVEAMDALVSGLGASHMQLAVVGEGELSRALRARVNELGLSTHVRFFGARPHEEIPRWMSAFDVLCLPSRSEGCPNVVLEALASGVPVVAARVGGVPELLDGNNGIVVPPEDPVSMAGALKMAVERPWNREALRASVKALSWDTVGDRYHELLRTVVAEWGRAQCPDAVAQPAPVSLL